MPSGVKTLEHHNLEEENYALKFNKLSRTITKNHKRKINKLSYIKINIYKAVISTFIHKRGYFQVMKNSVNIINMH